MGDFTISPEMLNDEVLPLFTLTVSDSLTTAIYCDTDLQMELAKNLCHHADIAVYDQKEGLYMRLTVEDNIIFFNKWFASKAYLPDILVLFELQSCAKKPLNQCTESEIRRVYFAKYYLSCKNPMIFLEPIQGIDDRTINTFVNMLQKLKSSQKPVLILVSNMKHALLLGDIVYKLQRNGIRQVEMDEEDTVSHESDHPAAPTSATILKIPAKVGDKMILFDPLEIDYIESQDGKGHIMINDQSYPMDSTLAEIEKKMNVYGFYRCHRSYIVNLQKVREIITWSKNTYSLRIDNKTQSTIPLSRTKVQDIQEKFNLK